MAIISLKSNRKTGRRLRVRLGARASCPRTRRGGTPHPLARTPLGAMPPWGVRPLAAPHPRKEDSCARGACFPNDAGGRAVRARPLRVVEATRNRKRPFRARCAASRSADASTTRRFAAETDTPRTGRKGRGLASRSQDEEFGANSVARVKNRDVHREWFAVCA